MHFVDNAKFHDGTPLTSEDVKFSLELYRDTADFPYLSSYPDVFKTIEAPDPTTRRDHDERPGRRTSSPGWPSCTSCPKHIWEKVKDPVAFDNAAMIGSGPFKLVENKQGEFTPAGRE